MKTAPKKIQNRAIKTACLYRDAYLAGSPTGVMRDVDDLSRKAFEVLVAAMECSEPETLMVHETLARIVMQTPVKPFTSKRLHRGA